MITLYGIKNCDTVRKARRWLEDLAVRLAAGLSVLPLVAIALHELALPPLESTRLHNEVRHHTVPHDAVVELVVHITQEIGASAGGGLGEQFEDDLAGNTAAFSLKNINVDTVPKN